MPTGRWSKASCARSYKQIWYTLQLIFLLMTFAHQEHSGKIQRLEMWWSCEMKYYGSLNTQDRTPTPLLQPSSLPLAHSAIIDCVGNFQFLCQCIRTIITKPINVIAFKERNLFFTVPEAEKGKLRVLPDNDWLPVSEMVPLNGVIT